MENNTVETIEKVEKIGKYKPSKKFLNFVAATSSGKDKVRFITNSALIRGSQLTGMGLEGIVFKLTICDSGTVDFEEVGTSKCDSDMLGRFVEDLCDRKVTGYAGKFIIVGVEFYTDDMNRCYLEIDHQKPIDKLASMLEDFSDESNLENVEISEKSKSFLDSLFVDEEDLVKDVAAVNGVEVVPIKEVSKSQKDMISEAFEKMNQDKIKELSERVKDHEKNIKKSQREIKDATKSLDKNLKDLKILNSRLESLVPGDPANGYCFFLSEEKKTGIEPDEKLVEIVGKISPFLGLIPDKVVELLTAGYYTINIAKADSYETELKETKENTKELSEIYSKIEHIDLGGKFSMKKDGEIEYRGDLNYHELMTKLIKLGFSQIPEFNKLCGSNSYGVLRTDDVPTLEVESKNCHENCQCETPCDDTCGCEDKKESK